MPQVAAVKIFACTITPHEQSECTEALWASDIKSMECWAEYTFRFELGEEKQQKHFQCHMVTKERTRPGALAKAIRQACKWANVVDCSAVSKAGFAESKNYCKNPDKPGHLAGPWASYKLATWNHVLTHAQVDAVNWQRKLRDYAVWHKSADKKLQRKLIWLFDPVGNSGKTSWSTYMRRKHGARTFLWSKANDIRHMVVAEGAADLYIFDLSRCSSSDFGKQDLYLTLEDIKNGYCRSGKYDGKYLDTDPALVIVLSNQAPYKGMVSADRWEVCRVPQLPQELTAPTEAEERLTAALAGLERVDPDEFETYSRPTGPVGAAAVTQTGP